MRVPARRIFTAATAGGPVNDPSEQQLHADVDRQVVRGRSKVDEEHEPGFHHESRDALKARGAVVHEEVGVGGHHTAASSSTGPATGGREAPGPSMASHPESGSGGGFSGARSGRDSPAYQAVSDEEMASAPESGTRDTFNNIGQERTGSVDI